MNTKHTRRYLGFRLDPNDPRKVTPQEVSEEEYFALGRPIWRHQKKMQGQGKCALNNVKMLWKCDGDCELCDYSRVGREYRLDRTFSDSNGETCRAGDKLASDIPTPDSIVVDQITLGRLLDRLMELCPEAIQTGQRIVEEDISTRKALEKESISRSLYRYRLGKAEQQLCEEFGVSDISELFNK